MAARRTAVFLAMSFAAIAMAIAAPVAGQAYPTRPIKLVVTFPAGSGADIVGCAVASNFSKVLGQPVVVENRAGAGGGIGNEAVAKAEPDGYTLLLGAAGAMTIMPNLYEKVGFDTFRDFEPIGLVGSCPFVLALNSNVPANSLAELTAHAKANPCKLNYGSSGNGGAPHLAGELYRSSAGIDIIHVPYKGLGPAITDLLGGQVQMLFADTGLIAPHVKPE